MKADKETLVKQRFWIGLGAFALFWLVVLVVALVSAGGKAAENAGKLKAQKEQIANAKDIKNESYTAPVTARKEELQGKKNVVWEQAWQGQSAGFMFWPHPERNPEPWVRLEQTGYFGEEIDPRDRTDFRSPGVYDSQMPVDGIKDFMKPVQPKGGDWNHLIRRATFDPHTTPSNEEVWLAQEDLWVQSELLNVVRAALDSARWFEHDVNFKRVELPKETEKPAEAAGASAAPDEKKATVLRQRFHNPNWQLDLVMEQTENGLTATPQTTLKSLNRGTAGQPVAGIDLLVGQHAAQPPKPQPLHFEGQPNNQGQVALAKAVPLPGFAADFDKFPFGVVLTADKADSPLENKDSLRYRLRNPNWELELVLDKAPDGQYKVSEKSKVKNINASQRTLSLSSAQFALWQGGRDLIYVTVPEEWLAYDNTTGFKKASQTFVLPDPKAPVEVYERFGWDTSPIKRVDAIELPGGTSFNSHRMSNLALKTAAQESMKPPEQPKDATASSGSGAPAGGPMGAGMGSGGSMSGAGAGAQQDTSHTPNGLVRNRYISVTEQVRHMPVALEVVCDQAHMQDVLTAVANSRLRIQITQVQWKRIRGVKSSGGDDTFAGGGMAGAGGRGPGMAGPGGAGGGMYGPSGYGQGRGSGGMNPNMYGPGGYNRGGGASPPGNYNPGGGYGPGMPGGSGSSRGPAGSGSSRGPAGAGGAGAAGPASPGLPGGRGGAGGGSSSASGGDDSDPNLVQLAVYGVAALYERYPPKQAKTDAAGAAGAPAATTPAQPAK